MNMVKDNRFCGMATSELFHKINNNFVREYNGIHYFKPTQDGQMDYMVYIALLSKMSIFKQVEISLNRLVETIGYKPRSGANNINNKVKESLDRLEYEYKLIIRSPKSTDKYIMLEVIVLDVAERFFKLNMYKIDRILNDSLFKLNKHDFNSKYKDKAKALYVYSYLLSMFGAHETTTIGITFNGCYPNMDKICKDCNITKEYLLKLLAYFEYDGLIYTANMGNIGEFDGGTYKACNYYTDSLSGLNGAYTYAKGYLDQYEYEYNGNYKQCKMLLAEIEELFKESYSKLKDKEIVNFKEHYKLMFKDTLNQVAEIFPDVSLDNFNKFILNRDYLNLSFYKHCKESKKGMLYLASIKMYNVLLLTHFRNKLKALMYMYNIR